MRTTLASIAIFFACAALARAANAAPETLPDTVVPVHYDLRIVADSDSLTWRGEESISIDVRGATADIVLNAAGLALDRVRLDGRLNGNVHLDAKLGRATLHFASPVAPGPHTLSIDYRGRIGRRTLGFFAMDYATPYGPRRTLATNFEPAYAREFLPCWDEPARKATFTLTADVPNDRIAVSNMPIDRVKPVSPSTKRVRFRTTPEMSTYLLFLAIGDFQRVSRTVDGIDVGVVVTRGDTAKGAYALDEAAKLLHYYDNYFGYRYPLPKLDLVAAPGTIDGGSMENWGAIFYSQDELLFDPQTSTESDRQGVFETVAHEMSHQWFGDLVTMRWWDDLWLNEGFARWMQTFAADALHPEWRTGLRAQSGYEQGRQADSAPDTHPVVQRVDTAAQAYLAFDAITYDKGAAVINMFSAYMGPDAFRDGVRRYIRAHAFGNSIDSDLWNSMQSVANKPVLKIAQDFTRQEGLPLVRVADRANGIALSEERFFADRADARNTRAQRWNIPLTVAAPGRAAASILLNNFASLNAHPPVLVNAGQTAYARVLYPQPDVDALLLNVPQLAPVDQMGMLNDSFALGLAGYSPLDNAFAVAQKIPADANPLVWQRVAQIVTELDRHYPDTAARAAWRVYARSLLAPVLARIGADPRPAESANVPLLRTELIETLSYLGDPVVIEQARRRFTKGGASAEERRMALDVVARHADPAQFESLLAGARTTKDPLEKQRFYDALGGIEDPGLARRMIAIALTSEVPAGSNVDIILHIAENHPELAWDQAVPHLSDRAAGISKDAQWQTAASIATHLSDPARISEVEKYENTDVPEDARRPFTGAVASIRRNGRILREVLPQLDRWIARGANSAGTR